MMGGSRYLKKNSFWNCIDIESIFEKIKPAIIPRIIPIELSCKK